MTAPPVRVVVADDHPVVRDGMRLLIRSRTDMDIVGEAADGNEVVAVTRSVRPDVVIMDVQMPGLNGIEAARRIVAECPGTGILVLTMFEDDETVFAAMRAGARGYLLKGSEQEEIARAVIGVANGDAVFGAAVAARILAYFAQAPRAPARVFPELTDRELEVLNLLAAGRNNVLIARSLGLSAKTVANNVSSILTKLHLADRSAAIIRARDAGLGG